MASRSGGPNRSTSVRRRAPRSRGAAVVEYVLVLMLLATTVSVGLQNLDREVEDEAAETGHAIGGDPGTSSTVALPTTTGGGGPTSTSSTAVPTFPVNSPPTVIVPDLTMAPGSTADLVATVTDDFSSLEALDLTWTVQAGLTKNSEVIDAANDHATVNLTAVTPGTYVVTLCAHDGLTSPVCDSGTVKVRSGIVTVSMDDYYAAWDWWNGSAWTWSVWIEVDVRDAWGNEVRNATISGRFVLDDGRTYVVSCNTGGSDDCDLWANFGTVFSTGYFEVTNVTGPCIDGWDGLWVPIDIDPIGGPPPPPTTTTTTTPTTTGPTSSTSSTTTTTTSTTTSTTSTTTTTTPTTTNTGV